MAPPADLSHLSAELRAVAAESVEHLDDAQLLARITEIDRLSRLVEASRVRLAAEVAQRSRRELGEEALCRQHNFVTPAALVAACTGASTREVRRWIGLGARLRACTTFSGAPHQPYPVVVEAWWDGSLGTECAEIISRECDYLRRRGCDVAELEHAERLLVDAGRAGLGADEIARLAIRVREHLDPDGTAPRDDTHAQERGLTLTRSSDGMFRGRIALTPEQGALWLGATGTLLSPRVRPRFVPMDGPEGDAADDATAAAVAADSRTGAQKLVDAVTELITLAAGSSALPHLSGSSTTVNVHIAVTDLESGRGRAWIDGVDEPVPASVVRQLTCHSPVAATVFGVHGEVLYQGKARRTFSPAQNRALAARDGGCVWPECRRAPSLCETHHVQEWRHPAHAPGRTDISNGVLLCHFHHRHLHRSEWRLVMRSGVPHLIPPNWVDPDRSAIRLTHRRTQPGMGLVVAAPRRTQHAPAEYGAEAQAVGTG